MSAESQSKPKPVACPKLGQEHRVYVKAQTANRILPSAWFLALVFARWEFVLHLELASNF